MSFCCRIPMLFCISYNLQFIAHSVRKSLVFYHNKLGIWQIKHWLLKIIQSLIKIISNRLFSCNNHQRSEIMLIVERCFSRGEGVTETNVN
jgi:hypothetical protein